MYRTDMPFISADDLYAEVWEWKDSGPILGLTRHKLPNHGRCQECKRRGRAEEHLVQEPKAAETKYAKFSSKAKGRQYVVRLAAPATRRKDGKILCEICSGRSGTKLVIDKPKKIRRVKTTPLLVPSEKQTLT